MIQLTSAQFGVLMFLFGMSMAYAMAWILDKMGRVRE